MQSKLPATLSIYCAGAFKSPHLVADYLQAGTKEVSDQCGVPELTAGLAPAWAESHAGPRGQSVVGGKKLLLRPISPLFSQIAPMIGCTNCHT